MFVFAENWKVLKTHSKATVWNGKANLLVWSGTQFCYSNEGRRGQVKVLIINLKISTIATKNKRLGRYFQKIGTSIIKWQFNIKTLILHGRIWIPIFEAIASIGININKQEIGVTLNFKKRYE